jgi:hypothetical protein
MKHKSVGIAPIYILLFVGVIGILGFILANQNKHVLKEENQKQNIENVINIDDESITKKENISDDIPLSSGEDVIRTFFSLIQEKKIPDAVSMMSKIAIPNDSIKQAWGVQFNAMNSVKVISIEPLNISEITNNKNIYKTALDISMNPDSVNEQIPYFGYENGTNIRWIELIKEGQIWKVNGIGTGP